MLGHTNLPEFVGDIDSEAPTDQSEVNCWGDDLPRHGNTRLAKLGEGGKSCDFSLYAVGKTGSSQKVKVCQAMERK